MLQAALFRIHAVESSGDLAAARQQLRELIGRRAATLEDVERVRAGYAFLPLCPQTALLASSGEPLPVVDEAVPAHRPSRIPILVILALVGAISLLPRDSPDAAWARWLTWALVFVLVAVVQWTVSRALGESKREKRARSAGVSAAARVVSMEPTGTSVNDVPEMLIHLDVLQPPGRSTLRRLMDASEVASLPPGAIIRVRIDPEDPSVAVFDR